MAKSKIVEKRVSALTRGSQKLRQELMKQLEGIDANILVSIVRQGGKLSTDEFIDYGPFYDSYNRGTWYKTFAKAEVGDPAMNAVRKRKKPK